jgi:hypothetical protein
MEKIKLSTIEAIGKNEPPNGNNPILPEVIA